MGLQYSHLSETERLLIEHGRHSGLSFAAIGRSIHRSASTVMRECKRGHWAPFGRYLALFGQRYYGAGRRHAGRLRRKLGTDLNSSTWQLVRRGLRIHWSPQQIAGRLRVLDPLRGPLQASPSYVCHETIYRAIYEMPRCPQRTEMIMQLRQSRAGRRRRSRGRQRFVGLQDFTPIALRPVHIESRQEPGHWEGDIVEGARGTRPVIATLVERSSRLVRLALLPDGTAGSLLRGLSTTLRAEAPWMRRSITYDRGTEMACHKQLAKTLGISIYICDAYHPWQRGANENTNGLLRQYLPKGMDLSQLTPADLLAIEFLLNNRPRRVLGYRTPQEVFDQLQASHRPQ
jgi:IS30 family transposase